MLGNRRLAGGRLFHKVSPGFADGMRCDENGWLWTSAADGVYCLTPDGRLLGKILTGTVVSSLTFGGRNATPPSVIRCLCVQTLDYRTDLTAPCEDPDVGPRIGAA